MVVPGAGVHSVAHKRWFVENVIMLVETTLLEKGPSTLVTVPKTFVVATTIAVGGGLGRMVNPQELVGMM